MCEKILRSSEGVKYVWATSICDRASGQGQELLDAIGCVGLDKKKNLLQQADGHLAGISEHKHSYHLPFDRTNSDLILHFFLISFFENILAEDTIEQ